MAREEANEIFAGTSFLYGGNAPYIDEIYARYQADPGSVDAQWKEFFAKLNDSPQDIEANARGASWERADWPVKVNGEWVSALDSDWGEVPPEAVTKAVGEKITERVSKNGAELSDAGFGARHYDDPGLQDARSPACRSGSAGNCR